MNDNNNLVNLRASIFLLCDFEGDLNGHGQWSQLLTAETADCLPNQPVSPVAYFANFHRRLCFSVLTVHVEVIGTADVCRLQLNHDKRVVTVDAWVGEAATVPHPHD